MCLDWECGVPVRRRGMREGGSTAGEILCGFLEGL